YFLGVAHAFRETLRRPRRRWPALEQRRQHRGAQKAPVVARIGVRGVLEPGELPGLRDGLELAAREAQQRTAEEAGPERCELENAAQAPHAGAAQHAQKQGLELIV